MSTTLLYAPEVQRLEFEEIQPASASRRKWPFIGVLTVCAILVHGYHPYSEDAGIYVPAIKKLLNPALYPHSAQFFLAPARLSFFSNLIAASVRMTHLPFSCALLLWHAAMLALLFAACWRLSYLCLGTSEASHSGSLLIAAFLTVPIAGSSLMLTDPYLTSRSLSTPALLFAVCFMLEDRPWKSLLLFLCALVVHPLMAAYGGVFLLSLWAVRKRWLWLLPSLAFLISSAAFVAIQVGKRFPYSEAYQAAALTRSYFFLSQWAWYDILGIIVPLGLFAWVVWREKDFLQDSLGSCALAAFLNGGFFLLLALAATRSCNQLSIARFQPMRSFHLVYILMFLLPLNLLARKTLEYKKWPFALFLGITASAMFFSQRQDFAASGHLELPGMPSANPWQRAFEWSRLNTPADALFALDPDYVNAATEDHEGFRAIAERSALADRAKDGGVVAVFPYLAEEWTREVSESNNVKGMRKSADGSLLKQAGVTWIVTETNRDNALDCPYRNERVSVCRLPSTDSGIVAQSQPVGRNELSDFSKASSAPE
jgi:hypothetical protein